MLADLITDDLPDRLDTGVCVVGAGPVGISLALMLGRYGIDVVLLESGGPTVEPILQDLYRARNVGRSHNGINLGRYRVFGGASTHWGGQILPFQPIDFESRPWIEHSGWPIDFQDIKPWYAKALDIEGLGDCQTDDKAVWQGLSQKTPYYGDEVGAHLSRWCPQPDFAQLHGGEIRRSSNLLCILHATVTAFACRSQNIVSARVRTLTGKTMLIAARRFVICVGPTETARLLLQPLDDGSPPPWSQCSDSLGRYFQDHPTFECADIRPRNPARFHELMDMVYLRGFKYQPRLYLSGARQRETRSLNAGGLVLFKTEISAQVLHQVRLAAGRVMRGPYSPGAITEAARSAIHAGPLVLRQAWRYLVQKRAYNPADKGYRLLAFIEQAPNPDSRLTLDDETDAFGMRRARLDWRLGQAEVDTLAVFADSVKRAFEQADLADVEIEPAVVSRDPVMLNRAWDNYHDIGMARMADSPAYGAVDSTLKLFGSHNGYVCSAAVFPTGSFSNPTHTAIALAVRLADYLHREGLV